MPCISTALVVGGGIAGLSAAVALGRSGVSCEVVEMAKEQLGASLAFSGRAAEALAELGVYDEVHATGTAFGPESTATSIRDVSGNVLSRGPQRPNWPGAKDGVAVYRPVFVDIMAATAEAYGVVVRKGVTAKSIRSQPDAAHVVFSDGEDRSYDLVIAADGIGSRIRNQIFPELAPPTYAGQMSIRWMAPGPPIEDEGWYAGPVGRLGFYYLPQGMVYVPAVITMPEWKRMSSEEVLALFERLLDSFSAPAVVELRKRLTASSELIGRPFEWILIPPPWYRDRVLVIGDAAHATTAHMGMGGGMAVEDAAVLGQCIERGPSLEAALEVFVARRFPRVKTVVETSVKLSQLEQAKAPPSENAALLTKAFAEIGQPY